MCESKLHNPRVFKATQTKEKRTLHLFLSQANKREALHPQFHPHMLLGTTAGTNYTFTPTTTSSKTYRQLNSVTAMKTVTLHHLAARDSVTVRDARQKRECVRGVQRGGAT